MAKKLSITIAGAVSLGSYESGVVFEILDAIAQHNTWVAAGNPGERYEIDVLTGASAGGMTVSMVAQRLLFDGKALTDPYNNPLFNAWVKEVDITGLVARGKNEPPSHSIFSSDYVAGISKKYLTARYDTPPPPPAQPHPALAADGKLHLGLSLSNLNGVDYQRDTASHIPFVYTRHADQQLVSLDRASSDRRDIWEPIRASAVACGAFPFAFRVQDLLRSIDDFKSPWLNKDPWGASTSAFFTYTDGGLFQNQPLGMAKNFVDHIPDSALETSNRAYLFVAPDPRKSGEASYNPGPQKSAPPPFNSADADYLALTKRLVTAIFDQSSYQDWVQAEGVNDRLRNFDGQAAALLALFKKGTLSAAISTPVSGPLLNAVFAANSATLGSIDGERARLSSIYAAELRQAQLDPAQAAAWIDAVLVLEVAAGLHRKDEMYIYDFVADDALLAGNDLEAFGGFFDVAFRKHDYDYGRGVAQDKLKAYAKPGSFGDFFVGLHWTPRPIDPLDTTLNGLTMARIDSAKRQLVCDQITAAADALLSECGINSLKRWAINTFVLRPKIKALLAL